MKFLHSDFNIGPSDVVQVELDKQANVMLLDDSNFSSYRHGGRFTYYGGLAKQSPVRLSPPRSGHWHVVVDLGGYARSVRASISLL
jgi:hypothetical protein